MSKKKVLMLAGAGWVGHHVANYLVREGCDVTVVHLSMDERFVPHLDAAVKHVVGNAGERSLVDDALTDGKPDVVINIHPNPEHLPSQLKMFRGRVQHYLQCSSAGVYVPTSKTPVDEDAPTHPREDFGPAFILKKQGDEMAMADHTPQGFAVTIVRPVIIFGAGFTPIELWGLRNLEFFEMVKRRDTLLLSTEMDTMMSVVWVEDVAQIFAKAVMNPDASAGQIFNAVSSKPFTHAHYLQVIGNFYGVEPKTEHVDTEEVIARRTGEPMFSETDYRFLMEDLSVTGAKATKLLGVNYRDDLSAVLAESLDP